MKKILIKLGFIKPTAQDLLNKKNSLLSVFTKTVESLTTLIDEQKVYIANLTDQKVKIEKEIDITHGSMVETENTIEKLINF